MSGLNLRNALVVFVLVMILVPELCCITTIIFFYYDSSLRLDDLFRLDFFSSFYLWSLPVLLPVGLLAAVLAALGRFSMRLVTASIFFFSLAFIPLYLLFDKGVELVSGVLSVMILAIFMMFWFIVLVIIGRKVPALEPYLRGRHTI